MPQEAEEWVVEHPEVGLQEEVVKDLLSSIPSWWMILVPMMTMVIYPGILSKEDKRNSYLMTLMRGKGMMMRMMRKRMMKMKMKSKW